MKNDSYSAQQGLSFEVRYEDLVRCANACMPYRSRSHGSRSQLLKLLRSIASRESGCDHNPPWSPAYLDVLLQGKDAEGPPRALSSQSLPDDEDGPRRDDELLVDAGRLLVQKERTTSRSCGGFEEHVSAPCSRILELCPSGSMRLLVILCTVTLRTLAPMPPSVMSALL